MELDSHTDTMVLGRNCTVLSYTDREYDVSPYSETYESIKGVPIVTGATSWTYETTGLTYILVFHEALWMGDSLDNSLVNPNQLWNFGIAVQDNPFDTTQMHISTEDRSILIPLKSEGTTVYMNTRMPSNLGLQTCPHIIMASKVPWDPRAVSFPQPTRLVEEGKLAQRDNQIKSERAYFHDDFVTSDFEINDMSRLTERLIAEVNVTEVPGVDVPSQRTFGSRTCLLWPIQWLPSAAGDSLRRFIHDYGQPERLTFDRLQEQCGKKTEFMKNVRQYSVDYHITEPERPNHNFSERVIREIRKKWFQIMVKKKVPRRLWDYGLRWV